MKDLTADNSAYTIAREVENFVENHVIPLETLWLQKEKNKESILSELLNKSLHQNLWGLFYPASHGGQINTLEEYLIVAEQEGRSELSQPLFGCQSALDAHMLDRYAPAHLQDMFLSPMKEAQAIPGYAMTEPDQPGSVPTRLETSAQKQAGQWVINGKKWFICNAQQATFFTVVACTNPNASADKAFSMLLVPADSSGCCATGPLAILGRNTGQGELAFNNVHIPLNHIIGQEGEGLALMKHRLGMGRLLRSMHWIGMAQRCFDLMGQRIYTSKSKATDLENKQLIRQLFFNSHQQITSAREILRLAARQVDIHHQCSAPNSSTKHMMHAGDDTQTLSSTLVSSAKVACANALYTAADAAIQVHGAEGLGDSTPLSNFFRAARATRIMDGADEALISSAGGQLMRHYRDHSRFNFSSTDLCH